MAQFWALSAASKKSIQPFVFNGSMSFSPIGTLRHPYCVRTFSSLIKNISTN
jgi:hypothetical protein